MSKTQIIKSSQLSWLNIINASEEEINYLRKKFKFHEHDLSDSLAHKHAQRPKLIIRPNYLFLVFLFPVYNAKNREIKPVEIDIFITNDHLITLHYGQLKSVTDLFNLCTNDPAERLAYLNDNSVMLLYEILKISYLSLFPMLDHISLDINNIEKNIFAHREREMVQEILIIKRNIVYFRKIMQSHNSIISKLISQKGYYIKEDAEGDVLLRNLLEYVENIGDALESYQQTIDALEDTNNALVTFKLNDIMRTLTIFSVIVFPLTLMAAVFGMNVTEMPISGSSLDFWKIVALMALASLCMYFYFRHKKWI